MSDLSQGLIIALFTAAVGSALAWLVGTQVSYNWDERRRRRESDKGAVNTWRRSIDSMGSSSPPGSFGARTKTNTMQPRSHDPTRYSGPSWNGPRWLKAVSRHFW